MSSAKDEKLIPLSIGIDLGTTYSCVGIYQNGRVNIIKTEFGGLTMPSYVAFSENGQRIVGEQAKQMSGLNSTRTVFDVKRLIGRNFHDEHVQKDIAQFPFKVVDSNGNPEIEISYNNSTHLFSPEMISSMILSKLKGAVEAHLGPNSGYSISDCVITVPAYFNDAQRQATKNAGLIAGLNVKRIINEPTAAALAYGLQSNIQASTRAKNILIFDLGGGTFDVSLLKLEFVGGDSNNKNDHDVGGGHGTFRVIATSGDTHLGGEDFDERLMDFIKNDIKAKFAAENVPFEVLDDRSLRRLRTACESTKKTLSNNLEATLHIDNLYKGKSYTHTFTRTQFETLCADLFKKCLVPIESVLRDGCVMKSEVDSVVLIGGSTRIPRVVDIVKGFFNKPCDQSIDPDLAVAMGATLQAAILNGEQISGFGKGNNSLLLIDVVPLSMGVELDGGFMKKIIERNTAVPCRFQQTVTTSEDDQTFVIIQVFQGERPLTKDNELLGHFRLDIPARPRGVSKILVTFEVDSDGILQVTARDTTSSSDETPNANTLANETCIVINSDRIDKQKIDRMLQEASEWRLEDRKVAQFKEALVNFDSYIKAVTELLDEVSDLNLKNNNIDPSEKESLTKSINNEVEWIKKLNEESLNGNFIVPHNEIENRQVAFETLSNPLINKILSGSDKTIDTYVSNILDQKAINEHNIIKADQATTITTVNKAGSISTVNVVAS